MTTELQPYVGPRPFEAKDQDLFFGREREANELKSLIIAHGIVLIYAQSGAGKTSLVNARLIPLLASKKLAVFPVARVRGLIPNDISRVEIPNLYTFNTLLSWAEPGIDPRELAQVSLAEFLSTRPRATGEEAQVIIFDQFEELFSFYPERWKDREEFIRQLCEALEADTRLRVLLVIREDYLAQLDSYAPILPEKLRIRYHLECMRGEAALEAVTGPLAKTGRTFADGVAEKLVDDLLTVRVETAAGTVQAVPGEFVESVQLQVVCQNFWRHLPPEATVVTKDHLQGFGDVNQALVRFYEECIQAAVASSGANEGDLREWFGNTLITPAGTRGTVFRGKECTGAISNSAVEVLEDLHIIRGEWRAGARWYELTHDRLIEPIRQSNQDWFAGRWEAEQIRRQLEAKAADWVRMGRGTGGLLDEVELREAQRWAGALEMAETSYAEDISALIGASCAAFEEAEREKEAARQRELAQAQALAAAESASAEQARRAERHLRSFSVALGIMLLIAILFSVAAVKRKHQAERLEKISLSRANAGSAFRNLTRDPNLSLLLAMHAVTVTHSSDGTVTDSAEAALHRAVQSPIIRQTFTGHTASVTGAAFSPDMRRLATASSDRTAKIWDLTSGKELLVFYGHAGALNGVAFSRDGTLLATASRDRTARIWNAKTGIQRLVLRHHKGTVSGVAFSPDGKEVATASWDGTAKIWNTDRGQVLRTLPGHAGEVTSVAFSPDGTKLATGSTDGTVRIWDAASGQRLRTLPAHPPVNSVAFSPDGKMVAGCSGGMERAAHIWNTANGMLLGIFPGHTSDVAGVAFHPDGKVFATASLDRTIKVWDIASRKEIGSFFNLEGELNSVAYSLDGKRLVAASSDRTAKVWDSTQSQEVLTVSGVANRIYHVAFSPNGSLGLATSDGTAKVWDVGSDKEVLSFDGHTDYVFGLAFSHDGKYLATASWDRTAKIVEIASGAIRKSLEGHSNIVTGVDFSPDGRYLATASWDSTAKVWDAASGKAIRTLAGHVGTVNSVAFSPDGRHLATTSADGTALIWDAGSGKVSLTLAGHLGEVLGVAFSRDGSKLATSGWDGTAKIWNTASGALIRTLTGHSGVVFGVAFSPDGKRLATAGWDKTAKVWDLASGNEVLTFTGFGDRVYSVAYSADGKYLAAGSRDGTVRVYANAIKDLMDLARRRITRGMSDEECRSHLHPNGCPPTMAALGLVALGNEQARAHDADSAADYYLKAKETDPSLDLDPYREARSMTVQSMLLPGQQLAQAGDIAGAVVLLRKAKELEPSLAFSDPTAEAKRVAAMPMVAQAQILLQEGDKEQALAKFRQAKETDPSLLLDPEAKVRRLAAQNLALEGRELARSDKIKDALETFRRAKKYNPSLALDPELEQRRLKTKQTVDEGSRLIRQGEVRKAIAAFRKAQKLDPGSEVPASHWNELCWTGTLLGHASAVMFACEEAVKTGYGAAFYRDSRGVARAQIGDYKGAIDDFEAYLAGRADEKMKSQRRRWINVLKEGNNPFTPQEIEGLFDQAR